MTAVVVPGCVRWRDVDPATIRHLDDWAEAVAGIYAETRAERGGTAYGVPQLQRLVDAHAGGGWGQDVVLKAPAVTTWRSGGLPSRGLVDTFVAFLWACGVPADHLEAWREGVCRMRRVRDDPRRKVASSRGSRRVVLRSGPWQQQRQRVG